MAHAGLQNLQYLLRAIDDERNDIFIHLNKRWTIQLSAVAAAAKKSRVFFTERLNTQWGTFSLVECELLLMKTAVATDAYEYYHLLSGNDMPIKSQDYIHAYFAEHADKEFMNFCGKDWCDEAVKRIKYYRINTHRKRLLFRCDTLLIRIQRLLGVNRIKNLPMQVLGGSQWASLTHAFVTYLLEKEDDIRRIFKRGACVDELYKQMMAYHSPFKENIFFFERLDKNDDTNQNMHKANARMIDWLRGSPYTYTMEDKAMLLTCPYLFARKFDCAKDAEIQQSLIESITE